MPDHSGGESSGETLVLLIIMAVAILWAIWAFVPSLFVVPAYFSKVVLSILGYPFSSECRDSLSILLTTNPFNVDKIKTMQYFETSTWNVGYVIYGILLLVVSFFMSSRYSKSREMMTPQKQIEYMAQDEQFPFLIPFIDVNPLDHSTSKGYMRFPDTMLNFAKRNKLAPMCPKCGRTVYFWKNTNAWACESQYLRVNIGVGSIDKYCRYKFKSPPKLNGFQRQRCRNLFLKELGHLGLIPGDAKKLPAYFKKHNKYALGVMVILVSKLEYDKDPTDHGEYPVMLHFVENLARICDGVNKSDDEEDGKGIIDEEAMDSMVEEAMEYLTPKRMTNVQKIVDNYSFGTTFMVGLLQYAREEKGVIPTSLFSHLLWYDRTLFIILNNTGRPSPFAEGAASWTFQRAEKAYGERMGKAGIPIVLDGDDGLVSIYEQQLGYRNYEEL